MAFGGRLVDFLHETDQQATVRILSAEWLRSACVLPHGVEIEFFLMDDSQGSLQPVKMVENVYSTASLNNKYLPILEEIVSSILRAGIEVRQFHSEEASGLFEISIEPLAPLQLADALIYCKEEIKTLCFEPNSLFQAWTLRNYVSKTFREIIRRRYASSFVNFSKRQRRIFPGGSI
jgi:hypothetical protein